MTARYPDTASTGATPAAPAMRAVVQDLYGDADMLRLDQVAVPGVGESEVLVRVHAAGLDRGTWHLMTGKPYLMRIAGLGFRGPKERVPGRDLAGTVEAVGSAVTRFAMGDEVYGIGRGSFAQYAVAAEKQAGPQAREPLLRAGGRRPHLRRHGPPGTDRPGTGRGRTARPQHHRQPTAPQPCADRSRTTSADDEPDVVLAPDRCTVPGRLPRLRHRRHPGELRRRRPRLPRRRQRTADDSGARGLPDDRNRRDRHRQGRVLLPSPGTARQTDRRGVPGHDDLREGHDDRRSGSWHC
jgi:hypothetical protein